MAWATMTTPSSTQSFFNLSGVAQPIDPTVEKFQRPGVNGHEFRIMGDHAPDSQFFGERDCTTKTAAETFIAAIRACQGTIQTITDGNGIVYSNVMILRVEAEPPQYVVGQVGGVSGSGAKYIVRLRIMVVATR
jgi:hypothetical protein